MSVFDIIKRGRAQAKEQNAKSAETKKKEEAKPAYRHVPTHAAIDALNGAPPGWREDDRTRILEANRRRSAMAASSHNFGMPGPSAVPSMMMPGLPRVASSLSHVTYPAAHANPHVQLPRSYSYAGPSAAGWQDVRMTNSFYGMAAPVQPQPQQNYPTKGKEVERMPTFESARGSSSSSAKGTSPAGSSNNSTSSVEDLQIKPTRHSMPMLMPMQTVPRQAITVMTSTMHPVTVTSSMAPVPMTAPVMSQTALPAKAALQGVPPVPPLPSSGTASARSSAEFTRPGTHRLHPSARRNSDASIHRPQLEQPAKSFPSPARDSRPPPSTRGFSAIPPVPALPPLQFGPLPGSLSISTPPSGVASSAASTNSSIPSSTAFSTASTSTTATSQSYHNSASYSTTSNRAAAPVLPTVRIVSDPHAIPNLSPATTSSASPITPVTPPQNEEIPIPAPTLRHKDGRVSGRRTSKQARFVELEKLESNVEKFDFELSTSTRDVTREHPRMEPSYAPPPPSNERINHAMSRRYDVEPASERMNYSSDRRYDVEPTKERANHSSSRRYDAEPTHERANYPSSRRYDVEPTNERTDHPSSRRHDPTPRTSQYQPAPPSVAYENTRAGTLPAMAAAPPQEPVAPVPAAKVSKKLSKANGGKLVKKNRMSKVTPVAG